MEIFKEEEEEAFSAIEGIIYACEVYDPVPRHLHKSKTKIINAAKLIIETHLSYYTILNNISDIQAYLSTWLRDLGTTGSYQTILSESISLMFDRTVSIFRKCTIEGGFPHLIARLYLRLKSYQKLLNDAGLKIFFSSYDYAFGAAYNLVNCSEYRYDEVHYISNGTYSLVASMKIDPAEVIKREHFRLTIPKFNISNILIEIFHLLDGLAFFKVNPDSLSISTASAETIFHSISEGNHQVLELGRSLMFPLLKTGDFEICRIDDAGAVITFTEAKDVKLEIISLDEVSWVMQWKSCLQNYERKAANDSSFIKTHLQFKKANNFNEDNNGLGLIVDRNIPTDDFMLASTNRQSPPPSNTGCSLHRSKPLHIPLSSVIREDFYDSSLNERISKDGDSSCESFSGAESILSDYDFHDNEFFNNQSPHYFSEHIDNNSREVVITDENTIISLENTQVSRWSNYSWQKISPHQLQVSIIQLRMGNFIVAYNSDHNLHQFKIRLCGDIKCIQSTEQDIQIRVPLGAIMCSVTGILNIRTKDADKLLRVLSFYTTDHTEAVSHSNNQDATASPLSSVSSAMDLKHSLQKCSSTIMPQELTQDVIGSKSDLISNIRQKI
ncbi:AIG_G0028240.mRNA.1.CDS.1 [Saccharomyces cerevisiae]|nr:AIG_G0028240.mRNA.1.CDS.1 [Saccharomyces cerevisiae]CAI6729565.1 AAB_G0028360.mRNA.1.CDS.1 [Saccharomyces cerevisiae]CAI6730531.1 AIG_G0028240.mRNA.1.CDS.1 [Saccharomyces cerevisiae]